MKIRGNNCHKCSTGQGSVRAKKEPPLTGRRWLISWLMDSGTGLLLARTHDVGYLALLPSH